MQILNEFYLTFEAFSGSNPKVNELRILFS